MNVEQKSQAAAPIATTTFEIALRHMKRGGYALARFGSTSESVGLCYYDRDAKTIRRLAFWKSTRYAEEIFAPFAYVVAADWVLLRADAFDLNPEETASAEAVRASAAESAEAIETALAEELESILDAAAEASGVDVARSAGRVC